MSRFSQWRVLAAFAAIYFIWGSSYLGIRFALEALPPFAVGGLRMTTAGLMLYAITRLGGARPATRGEWRSASILGFFMFFVGNGALVWAELRLSSGLTATLYATVPIWVVILGWLWLRGPRPSARVFVGLALGMIGLALLTGAGGGETAPDGIGIALIMVSAVSWSFGSLLSRRIPMPESAFLGAALNLFSGGVMLLLASLLTGEWAHLNLAAAPAKSLLSILYLAIGPSVIAFGSYMWLMTTASTARVATYAYVNPVVAVFLGWALNHETLTLRTLITSGIIIAGVALITTARSRSIRPIPQTEPPPSMPAPLPAPETR
jgi:drug/metabolite transporter (DMT)-like permease